MMASSLVSPVDAEAVGSRVLLQLWVEPGNLDKTQHAMESLKHSIRWNSNATGWRLIWTGS